MFNLSMQLQSTELQIFNGCKDEPTVEMELYFYCVVMLHIFVLFPVVSTSDSLTPGIMHTHTHTCMYMFCFVTYGTLRVSKFFFYGGGGRIFFIP